MADSPLTPAGSASPGSSQQLRPRGVPPLALNRLPKPDEPPEQRATAHPPSISSNISSSSSGGGSNVIGNSARCMPSTDDVRVRAATPPARRSSASALPPRPESARATFAGSSTPRPSPRLKFGDWEDRLRVFQREVQSEFCKMEAFHDVQQSVMAQKEEMLARREAEQRVVEEHKMQLQGLGLDKLSISELEQLETVQVAAVRRTRKRKDVLVQQELARLQERVQGVEDERKCKICLENTAGIVLAQCGHRCCEQCCQRLRGKCHICRAAFTSTVSL